MIDINFEYKIFLAAPGPGESAGLSPRLELTDKEPVLINIIKVMTNVKIIKVIVQKRI